MVGLSVSSLHIPDYAQPWEEYYGKPERIVSTLDIMLVGPIGGAAFNNEFGRPNICGYFRSCEMDQNGQRRGYHKPIMIAGGYGNICQQHVDKPTFQPGARLVVLAVLAEALVRDLWRCHPLSHSQLHRIFPSNLCYFSRGNPLRESPENQGEY